MSRTVVDLDDDALSLASEELGTTSKVATVNAALRRVANQRAAARMLELLDETGTDLSDQALRGAWRDARARAVFLDLRTAHVIAACKICCWQIWRRCWPVSGRWTGRWRS